MEIVTISILCVSVILLSIYMGEQQRMFSQIMVLVFMVFIMFLIIERVMDLLKIVSFVQDMAGIDDTYVQLLLKMMGMIIVAEFTADICEQEGYKVIGKQVLLFGRVAVLMVGYPLLMEFMEIINRLLAK